MREEIRSLLSLGPLPDSEVAEPVALERFETLLRQISRPVTDEEARALVHLFGADDCFGLAWTIVHLVESAPNWPLEDCLTNLENPWILHLRRAADNARGRESH